MKINKVLGHYYRAYYKAAAGKEEGRSAINAFKKTVNAGAKPGRYLAWRKRLMRLFAGHFYWPNTFPNAVDDATAAMLYSLVRLVQPDIVLEIGTAYGNSALAIGQALEDNKKGKLYTIDPIEREIANIAIKKSGLKHRINYILGYSYDVIPSLGLPQIDIAFIDANHSGEHPSRDFHLVHDLLRPGGFLVFHDSILYDGVKRAVAAVKRSGKYESATFPTLSGATHKDKGALPWQGSDFTPAGLTIARKLP
jgi:predicted O-methyltransferase YrrM